MQGLMTYENIRDFAYTNDKLIKGEIRGIVLQFYGLNNTRIFPTDPDEAFEYAEKGIVYVVPYANPWHWMNAQAVRYTDEIIAVLCAHYGLDRDTVKIVSSGGSMGGLSAIVYTAYAAITPAACVANCPVCDLVYHYTERNDLPRTLYSAFFDYDGDLESALASCSPLHLVPKMPDVPYTIFHCEKDQAVNLEKHSVRFVKAMEEAEKNIRLVRVPYRGHCSLSPEAALAYRNAILSAFEE